MWETWIQYLGWEDPQEEDMATHSSIIVWRNPWREEPGRLQPIGLQSVRHNWVTKHSMTQITKWTIWTDKHNTDFETFPGIEMVKDEEKQELCFKICEVLWNQK